MLNQRLNAGFFAQNGLYGAESDFVTEALLSWRTHPNRLTRVVMSPAVFSQMVSAIDHRFKRPFPFPVEILGTRMEWDKDVEIGSMYFYVDDDLVGEIRGWM